MQFNNEKGTVTLTIEQSDKISFALNMIDSTKKNKLSFAATLLSERIIEASKKYGKKLEILNVEYSAKDEKGDFKMSSNGKNYIIEPSKMIEYNEKVDELRKNLTIEIEIYKCKDKSLIDVLPIPFIYTLNKILFDYDFSEFETTQEPKELSEQKSQSE